MNLEDETRETGKRVLLSSVAVGPRCSVKEDAAEEVYQIGYTEILCVIAPPLCNYASDLLREVMDVAAPRAIAVGVRDPSLDVTSSSFRRRWTRNLHKKGQKMEEKKREQRTRSPKDAGMRPRRCDAACEGRARRTGVLWIASS